MSGAKEKLNAVTTLLEGIVAREGFELVDLELVTERGRTILRLFIDTVPPGTKERGVSVDDCSKVSRVVGDLLDVEDAIDGPYDLEVSSPGLFRPLTKEAHFDRALGERVKVKTYEKIEGRRVFTGTLTKREGQTIIVRVDGIEHALDLGRVAKANLEPEL
jgi:ribosome maturation factor RimP